MKRKSMISCMLIIVLMASLLMACSENEDKSIYQQYYDAKVEFVGNNSEVSNLLNILGASELGDYTIELDTDKSPYVIRIKYSKINEAFKGGKAEIEAMRICYNLLALVDNVSIVTVKVSDLTYVIDIESANHELSLGIKEYGESVELVEKLNKTFEKLME